MCGDRGRYRWTTFATWALVVPGVLAGAWTSESVVGRLLALAGGGAIGALVALVGGSPSRQATALDVVEGLGAAGLPVARLAPHPGDARGSKPWIVELETGTRIFVKTHSAEERIADLLFRLWRIIRLRTPRDARPDSSLLRAVEHEAFVAARADAAGARTPRLISLGGLPSDGVFAAYEMIEGRTLEGVGADLTDGVLRDAWSLVQILQRAGIAHRDLRAANLLVRDGEVWLIDFGFAETAASVELLRLDRVELLASTAAVVGQDRAVDAAVAVLGREPWEDALPLVQPLAVSAATRDALGRQGFRELRETLALATDQPEVDLPRLGRIDRTTLLTLLALGAAVWVLVPQIAESGDLWERVGEARPHWLALAATASIATYLGAALALRGANAQDLPMTSTIGAQVASSFANRITPAKAGGVALNVRWLVRQGVDSPSATAAVGMNVFAGVGVHVILMVFVVLWAGTVGLGDLQLPSAHTVLVGLGVIASVVAITFAVPPLRELVRHRVVPRLRESGSSVRQVITDPRRLVLLFGGSAVVTLAYIATLALSMRAFDVDVALSTVALVYLAGSALASAAPTPGGLGATEAIFVAAFVAVGVPQGDAIAGVLVFRAVTFWLPILPGWIAFMILQRAGQL
jgi:undecaprenyl-diphosphatase